MFYDFGRGCAFQYEFFVSISCAKVLFYLFYRQDLSITVIDIAFMCDEFVVSSVKRKVTVNYRRCYSYHEYFFRFIPAYRFGNNEVQVMSSRRWN